MTTYSRAHIWKTISISIGLILYSFCSAETEEPKDFETTSTMRYETKHLVYYLERQHYLGKNISDLDQQKLVEEYVGDLDVHHLFFLQDDIIQYQDQYADLMPSYLSRGRLDPAFDLYLDFRDHVKERIAWIQKRLNQPFDFNETVEYIPDRSELDWPATHAEADAIWDKHLKYEILNEILSELGDEEKKAEDSDVVVSEIVVSKEMTEKATESVRKRYERLEKWVDDMEPTEVQEIFLTTLTHQYDPHSTFMSADTLEEFAIAMRNSLVGIGALLSEEDGYCTIRELLPGGPAEDSHKLKGGDQIVGVAQGEEGEFTDVIGMKLNKVVQLIRGKKGTVVRLLIRPGEGDPSERKIVPLVRDQIKLTAKLARAEVFEIPSLSGEETIPIGVIELPAFYGSTEPGKGFSNTTDDVEELLERLKEIGVQGIVLDLRNNGGGLLSEAISLTGLFIPVGPVVQVKDYGGQVQEYLDQDPKVAWDGPLLVLVSRYSASASEIAAGALKNHGRALIVGDEETHGKGTVQAVFEMNRSSFLSLLSPKRGAAKVTIQKYYLPDGTSTQIRGVSSDIVLPSANAFLPIGEGDLPNALEWDRIKSLDWDYDVDFSQRSGVIDNQLVSALRNKSLDRQHNYDEFAYLNDNINWFQVKQEQKEISLNLDERRAIRDADIEFRDSMKERLEALSNEKFDSAEILLKVAEENENADEVIDIESASSIEQKGETVVVDEIVEEDEDLPDFDINLRESLRIMRDWLDYQRQHEQLAQSG